MAFRMIFTQAMSNVVKQSCFACSRGGATTSPRVPFPIGQNKSMIRFVNRPSLASSLSCSSGAIVMSC